MSKTYGPYYRIGEPGGPGCNVAALAIALTTADGSEVPGQLLDAVDKATELELLRTVAKGLGVRWGHDDHGWWAAVPELELKRKSP